MWEKGKSGNPRGRPKKKTMIREILDKELAKTIQVGPEKERITAKKYLARQVVSGALKGTIPFIDGRSLTLNTTDWLAFTKWLYQYIDPPTQQMDLTSGGQRIPVSLKTSETFDEFEDDGEEVIEEDDEE